MIVQGCLQRNKTYFTAVLQNPVECFTVCQVSLSTSDAVFVLAYVLVVVVVGVTEAEANIDVAIHAAMSVTVVES